MGGTADAHADILERLGPHRTGSGCVYVTRLDKVDEDVLRELFEASLARLAATYDG
jgi:Mrp family chromosome partitioning ATPase